MRRDVCAGGAGWGHQFNPKDPFPQTHLQKDGGFLQASSFLFVHLHNSKTICLSLENLAPAQPGIKENLIPGSVVSQMCAHCSLLTQGNHLLVGEGGGRRCWSCKTCKRNPADMPGGTRGMRCLTAALPAPEAITSCGFGWAGGTAAAPAPMHTDPQSHGPGRG